VVAFVVAPLADFDAVALDDLVVIGNLANLPDLADVADLPDLDAGLDLPVRAVLWVAGEALRAFALA
jgi:hypothetical protein